MSENTNENRLPPPAFPPGVRRHVHRNSHGASEPTGPRSVDQAFINPDEPLPERGDSMGRAFISPDEPIPERKIELLDEFRSTVPVEPGEEGEVVGMDLDPHLEPEEVISGGDPHVMEVMAVVSKLAADVQRRGEAGLRTSPHMSRFESTMRAYCIGYLAGRRAEEPPMPVVDEPLPSDG